MIRVLHWVSVMDRGGQETFIMNIYRNIDRDKVQFDFLCSLNKKGDYDDEIKSLGGNIFYLDIKRKGGKFSKYYFELKETSKLLSKIADKYDIIHLHNYHAFSSYLEVKACKKAGFKNIILHSHNSCAPRIKLHKLFRPLLARQKITRFACSQEAGKWLHDNRSFEVIYNGIDTSQFYYDKENRLKLREELGLINNFVIGMVGRFNYQKNHMFALEVFSECVKINHQARLVLVGKGELEQGIIKKVEELSLQDKVIFLGVRNDVNKLMSAFDTLLMPSLFEGLGVVLIEAQYSYLPVIVSDNIPDETYISDLLKPINLNSDKKIWANTILQLKHINREKITISDNNFNINFVASELYNKYKNLVEATNLK